MNTMRKGQQGDDPAWEGTPPEGGRRKYDPAVVTRLREDFWRQMDRVPLSVPRWDSIPRMNANLKWLLHGGQGRPEIHEDIIRMSFRFFRNEVDSMELSPGRSCWAMYFARKTRYIAAAYEAQGGARGVGVTSTPEDIAKEQQRRRRRIIQRDD